jgi:hypothetical protein
METNSTLPGEKGKSQRQRKITQYFQEIEFDAQGLVRREVDDDDDEEGEDEKGLLRTSG